jgi:hypothetical protein
MKLFPNSTDNPKTGQHKQKRAQDAQQYFGIFGPKLVGVPLPSGAINNDGLIVCHIYFKVNCFLAGFEPA